MKRVALAFGIVVAVAMACEVPTASAQKGPETPMGTVLFDADSDVVTPAAVKILDRIATQFKDPNTQYIIIRGHSELTEHAEFGKEYGVGLSQRRAANVRSYFFARGIKHRNLITQAFGVTKPIKGAAAVKLRRVEVVFSPDNGF